ncbi:3-dehydroquinate synthase [Chloroflexia bacterium SDU3-3]|nr:3-dehydroquinate synthase [Chloroflexia bacterium SDU3-3]
MTTPAPLTITTPAGTYEILVGAGVLATLPGHLARLGLRGKIWLISDAAVYNRFGLPLLAALEGAGYGARGFAVPSGEQSKDLATLSKLYDWLIGGGVERRDVVLALGGGVVGDLAGFAAASILRGVAFIQLPTTLLAMVDSALGGKTGVNHPLGKNLIGAFHQPRLVLADTSTLATLPPRELRAGWAETIKHGVIQDRALFERLEQIAGLPGEVTAGAGSDAALALPPEELAAIVRQAAAVKAGVVTRDERETGERMLLNYGHTLGHAIEAAAGYGTLLHGEAVAIGMELAAQIAVSMGTFAAADVARQRRLLHAYGLPTALPPSVDPEDLIERTLRDKKVQAGKVRWVLPTSIGAAVTRSDVAEAQVAQVLADARLAAES